MNVFVLATAGIGVDLIEIIRNDVPIKGVMGLSDRNPGDKISGYVFMGDYCRKKNLNFISLNSHNLKDKNDIESLSSLDIDILIVGAWSRLVPNWLIDQCSIGAIGAHGSSYGITGGRGRAPENWSLILNESKFSISIFKLDAGVDSGDIIDTKVFSLSKMDDIASARYKMIWNVSQMIIKLLTNSNLKTLEGTPQKEPPRYLPQRKPEDGKIDWNRTSDELFNFIRALTKPYPGAFSKTEGSGKIIFWAAIPLDGISGLEKYQCGEIIKYSHIDNQLVIKTGNSALLVSDYEFRPNSSTSSIKEGTVLESVDFFKQCNEIFNRHYSKNPDKPIQEKIVEYAESYRNKAIHSMAINE